MKDIIFECEKCKKKEKHPKLDGCSKCRGTYFKAIYE